MEKSQGEPDADAFRAELRAWLSEHLTLEIVAVGDHGGRGAASTSSPTSRR